MNTPALALAFVPGLAGCEWGPAPADLGSTCPSCCPPAPHRGPDPRRWLDGTPRPDTTRLALACALVGFEGHTATLIQASELTRRARLRAQQLFPYGLGPVLGDLMLPADGGGDMLRALTDVVQSLFARRRPPRVHPVCPWGSTDGAGCGRDPFGRLVHDHCRTPIGPVPPWRAKSWAAWTRRTAHALDRLLPHLLQQRRPQPADEVVPRRIEAGKIGPITLLIGRDGPAQRARASSSALTALILALKPAHLDDFTALVMLHNHLKTPSGGPSAWGWHGYAPRSLFTAALQARHASVHHGHDDILVENLARHIAPDRRPERIAQGLLQEGWDDQVHGDDELEARLRAAVRAATSADTELWERTTSRQRVFPLDNADLLVGGGAADEDVLGRSEEVDRVLAKLSPAEREVADCYAVTGLTWQQAALQAGQPTLMGERVRRKLKRLAKEFQRRRSSETNPR
ncbi:MULTISPECIES: hypothetical protein [unclassified Streptomyces]|uniref:hypothetical protein n=1 Tax=unclassified Streptomyces TaxID=2593676 RepID=UPI002E0D791E|nr:hypothetical protein OG243_00010 [Streptomyces sp. NBC_01318]WSJ55946.1 hypothetical protein OG243_44530 [Streptomyces sp. NBC_01318]